MKAFVPGYGVQDTPQVREKSGKVAGAVGIATNLLLFAIKLAAGLVVHVDGAHVPASQQQLALVGKGAALFARQARGLQQVFDEGGKLAHG